METKTLRDKINDLNNPKALTPHEVEILHLYGPENLESWKFNKLLDLLNNFKEGDNMNADKDVTLPDDKWVRDNYAIEVHKELASRLADFYQKEKDLSEKLDEIREKQKQYEHLIKPFDQMFERHEELSEETIQVETEGKNPITASPLHRKR